MLVLELKRDSAEESELLEAAAAAHGGWVYAAALLMERVWLMRSVWAPGLRYVGGMARAIGSASSAPVLSVGGTGLRLEDALAGCLAEATERTAQVERAGDVVLSAPIADVRVPDRIAELIDLLTARDPAVAGATIDWIRARHDATGEEALLPADWCLRRARPGALAIPGGALSSGCAAGATHEDATVRGLLELAERDAAARWWIGGASAATLRPESTEAAAAARIAGELRLGTSAGRTTMVLDITSDLAVPVMAALSFGSNGTGLAVGLSAALSAARATASALLELGQMELGLQLASEKRDQIGETALSIEDRRHLARAAAAVADLAPLHALSDPHRHEPGINDDRAASARLAAILSKGGIDAWSVDLTRPENGLAVVKVVAPQLQPMPGDIVTARLAAVRHGRAPPRVPLM